MRVNPIGIGRKPADPWRTRTRRMPTRRVMRTYHHHPVCYQLSNGYHHGYRRLHWLLIPLDQQRHRQQTSSYLEYCDRQEFYRLGQVQIQTLSPVRSSLFYLRLCCPSVNKAGSNIVWSMDQSLGNSKT